MLNYKLTMDTGETHDMTVIADSVIIGYVDGEPQISTEPDDIIKAEILKYEAQLENNPDSVAKKVVSYNRMI